MNTRFENTCIYTYDCYLQLKKKTMDRSAQHTGMVLLAIFAALAVLTVVKGWYLFTFAAMIAVVFLIFRLFLLPVVMARFAAKKNREIHGRDIETVNRFYEDHVLAVNTLNNNSTNIQYTQVLKLIESKNLYIITMEKGLSLMIDKGGFTKGSREDFVQFMNEKCVNAEVKL